MLLILYLCGIIERENLSSKFDNEKNKTPIPVIFGVITTGYEWLFLKLENKEVIIDTRRYSITDLEDLLGVWQTVINQF